MAQPKVFVSHSHVNDAFAERLVADLRAAGVEAWLDKTDLGPGNFQQHINNGLTACDWFVLVLTRSALGSPWVQQEVDAANRLKHQGRIQDLIFIQAEPVEHHELPPLWGVYNIFDATTEVEYTSGLERLVKAVGGTAKTERKPVPQAKTPVVPVTIRQTLFGDVVGMNCPHCGAFNQLDEVERLVDKASLPSTLWGSCPAQCGKCDYSFYYTPPVGR